MSEPITSDTRPRVLGAGGIFLRARDPAALRQWYVDHLGLDLDASYNGGTLIAKEGDMTAFSLFSPDTAYFGEPTQQAMLNWRVADLDVMLTWLRNKGARVDERTESHEYGKFGWAWDGEGNRFELWQPVV